MYDCDFFLFFFFDFLGASEGTAERRNGRAEERNRSGWWRETQLVAATSQRETEAVGKEPTAKRKGRVMDDAATATNNWQDG